jgi:hypothetical protein
LHIECLCISFKLDGCHSLKDKRQRLSGLRDRYGKRPEMAVIESGGADIHEQAEWSFIVVAANRANADRLLQKLEEEIATTVDARIVSASRHVL